MSIEPEPRTPAEYGLWELAVLALLREKPMHPYEIQRLLKSRHKDDVLVLKRGSLYHAIRRLVDAALIEELATTREGLRPERTTYAITPAGEDALLGWLKRRVAVPLHEQSHFMGSISFLYQIDPTEAATGLEQRLRRLQEEIARFDAAITNVGPRIGRIHVLESEYARAMRVAEAKWTREILADLRNGDLTWSFKAILRQVWGSAAAPGKSKRASAAKS
jgi:DNA-binding PadR family transcriptional regulator